MCFAFLWCSVQLCILLFTPLTRCMIRNTTFTPVKTDIICWKLTRPPLSKFFCPGFLLLIEMIYANLMLCPANVLTVPPNDNLYNFGSSPSDDWFVLWTSQQNIKMSPLCLHHTNADNLQLLQLLPMLLYFTDPCTNRKRNTETPHMLTW